MAESNSSEEEKKAIIKRLEALPKMKDREKLRPWHTIALIRYWLFGEPLKHIAESMGKSVNSLRDVAKSPGAKRLKEYLVSEEAMDPVKLARDMAKANSLGVTADWYIALEWAKEARDYKAVSQMTKDLAALGGVQATPPKQEVETKKTVTIVFEGSDLDQKTVEADWEQIADEDDDADD